MNGHSKIINQWWRPRSVLNWLDYNKMFNQHLYLKNFLSKIDLNFLTLNNNVLFYLWFFYWNFLLISKKTFTYYIKNYFLCFYLLINTIALCAKDLSHSQFNNKFNQHESLFLVMPKNLDSLNNTSKSKPFIKSIISNTVKLFPRTGPLKFDTKVNSNNIKAIKKKTNDQINYIIPNQSKITSFNSEKLDIFKSNNKIINDTGLILQTNKKIFKLKNIKPDSSNKQSKKQLLSMFF